MDDKISLPIIKMHIPQFLNPNPSPYIPIATRTHGGRTFELIKLKMRSKEFKFVVGKEMAYDNKDHYAQNDRRACVEVSESEVVGDSVAERWFG